MFSPETVEEYQAVWDQTVAENIFVVCKTPMAKSITRRTLLGFRKGMANMWAPDDMINKIKNQPELFIEKIHKLVGKNMKINAVVGNPPYQEVNKGNGNGADPLYHYFIDRAVELSDRSTLIHPARFLFNAGKTPKDWNAKMLNDKHFRVVRYWPASSAVFPNVDIKGGVAITMVDKTVENKPIGFFSAYSELKSILSKVKEKGESSFMDLVGPREMYRLTDVLYAEHPELENRQSKGHKFSLGSNILEVFPELLYDKAPEENSYARIYGRYDNARGYKWIKDSYITHPESFGTYKVIVPQANGTGAIGEVLSTPIIGTPMTSHTDTFLSIGKFEKQSEATNCWKYVCSKFARTMLGTLKVTQANPRDTWANVPMQDFTEGSDIDWSGPIADIDRQLYAKYGLTDEEVDFIERMIKPME